MRIHTQNTLHLTLSEQDICVLHQMERAEFVQIRKSKLYPQKSQVKLWDRRSDASASGGESVFVLVFQGSKRPSL